MKHLLAFAALVVATQAVGHWNEGLFVRFGVGLGIGRDFFIAVPQTLTAAKNSRWVQSPRVAGQPNPSLVLYNPSRDDVVLGAFYDTTGRVAGLQIAIPQDSFTDAVLDWTTQGYKNWTAPANSNGVVRNYWATALFFVSSKTLSLSDAEKEAVKKGNVLQEDNIYVTGIDGELMPISTDARKVADTPSTLFTRQACIPLMGRHYYYNTTVVSECTSRGLFPWFALVDQSPGSNQLIGTGFVVFGKLPEKSLVRDYFERPPPLAVRAIVTDGPACLNQLAETVGLVTMHIYYVNSPALIGCVLT